MAKIFVGRPYLPILNEILSPHGEIIEWPDKFITRHDLLKNVEGVDALIYSGPHKVDSELLEKAGRNLKVVVGHAAGVDHIDAAECMKRGIKIGRCSGVMDNGVAEMAVGLLLAAARCYKSGFRCVDRQNWGSWKSGLNMAGREIGGSVIGIFGLGGIGLQTARILRGFRPSKILYHNRSINEKAQEVDAVYVDFDTLLRESDFVIATCSLNSENLGLFNEKAFTKMKSSSVFVNMSRGGLVNQGDLVNGLRNNDIWAAGLDVTSPEPLPKDHPLVAMENCVITPHLGSSSFKVRYDMAVQAARNVLAGLKGDPLPSPYPSVKITRTLN